jgi:F0F1-type ATP synthase membrane subunit a
MRFLVSGTFEQIMRKSLLSLLPFIICLGIAVFIGNLEPKDFPHITYPYRTPENLEAVSSLYIFVGLVLSILSFLCFLVYDIFKYFEKKYRLDI